MGQPHRPSSIDYRRLELRHVDLGESSDAAPERLDETPLLETHRIWEGKDGSPRDVPLRHDVELGKASGADVVSWKLRAHGVLPSSAELALVARCVVMGEHPVAGFNPPHPSPDLCDLPDDLVTQDRGRRDLPLDFLQVGSADSTGAHLDQ